MGCCMGLTGHTIGMVMKGVRQGATVAPIDHLTQVAL